MRLPHELMVLVRKWLQVSARLGFISFTLDSSALPAAHSSGGSRDCFTMQPKTLFQSIALSALGLLSVAYAPVHAQAPDGAVATPLKPDVGNRYIIGPGDTLQVFVWRSPELSTSVPVRPDGKISTPLVEDMIAVGKTPSSLARDIEKVLAEFIRSPQVNIIVSNPVSTFSQVKVIGQVTTPQSMAYREGIRVLDVVLAAGGLGEFAAGNRAKIVRTQNGKETTIRVKLDDLVNKGAMKHNLELQPGDVLVVPESMF
jgi:polysaccharide export outer membrane protein